MILSAGMIIVRRVEGRWLYLLLRAYKYWDFPKGEVEEGENPFAAAQREVREETGLENLIFPWGRAFKETAPYRNGKKKARYYLAATEGSAVVFPVNPELGRPEHHEFRWLEGDALRELTSKRLHPVIEWAEKIVEG
jgi:bis(5'-nucleosidyl)-tetraphosphatase